MAINYTAKEYVDDQTSPWPINGSNLTEDNENLVNVTKAVNGVEKTGLICSIDGNGVPNIPDAASGVTYLQDEWATTDGWATFQSTFTVSSGKGILTISTGGLGEITKVITGLPSKVVRVRARSLSGGNLTFRAIYRNSSFSTSYKATTFTVGTAWTNIDDFSSSESLAIGMLYQLVGSVGDSIEIDYIYIGSGLYTSKVYDKSSNGNHFTNYGALPVQGYFGKELKFLGAQYLQADNPVIGTTGTIAIRFKRGTLGTEQWLLSNTYAASNGMGFYFNTSNILRLIFSDGTSLVGYGTSVFSSTSAYSTVVVNSSGQVFYDGVLSADTVPTTWVLGLRNLVIGSNLTSYFNGTISHSLYTTDIWTADEAYAWNINPNGIDEQQKSAVCCPNTIVVRGAEGGIGVGIKTKTGSASGEPGTVWVDANYIYVQTATGTVKRVALSTF